MISHGERTPQRLSTFSCFPYARRSGMIALRTGDARQKTNPRCSSSSPSSSLPRSPTRKADVAVTSAVTSPTTAAPHRARHVPAVQQATRSLLVARHRTLRASLRMARARSTSAARLALLLPRHPNPEPQRHLSLGDNGNASSRHHPDYDHRTLFVPSVTVVLLTGYASV